MDDCDQYKTIFKLISNSPSLPFDYERSKDGFYVTTASELKIDMAEDAEFIEVIERKVPYKSELYCGRPEPILNGTLQIIQPNEKGTDLEQAKIGDFKCQRCGEISFVSQDGGKLKKPFECFNDACGRKGPFIPMFPIELLKPIWKLPFSALESSPSMVYEDVYNFIKEYLVLKPDEYHLMSLWIIASYLVDDFKTVPYLLFIAPKESGKSQAIIMLKELAYRAFIAASVTPASLFRAIELWKVTMLIDEAETQVTNDTESGQALYQTLNMGYKRGAFALRVEGDARIPTPFDVFGFKAIASTKIFLPTLESRSIIINMTQGKPEKIIIDELRSDIIRSELLYFRFRNVGKLNIIQPSSNSGRIIEIMTPLYTVAQIFKGLDGIKTIVSYEEITRILNDKIKDLENLRSDEEHSSIEAMVIEEINDLRHATHDEMDIKLKSISFGLGWIDEYSDIQKIKEANAKIGRILKVMGIATHRKKDGVVIEILKPEIKDRIDKAVSRYLKITDPDKSDKEPNIDQKTKVSFILSEMRLLQSEGRGSISLQTINEHFSTLGIKKKYIETVISKLKFSGDIIETSTEMFKVI